MTKPATTNSKGIVEISSHKTYHFSRRIANGLFYKFVDNVQQCHHQWTVRTPTPAPVASIERSKPPSNSTSHSLQNPLDGGVSGGGRGGLLGGITDGVKLKKAVTFD